jgi:hypothetical protein
MRNLKKYIDPAQIREYFLYDPLTGELRWRKLDPLVRNARVGDLAGCSVATEDGRVTVGFKKKLIRSHVIIWAYQTGKWPTCRIDHKNQNASDNRWSNLRLATQGQNTHNSAKPRINNTSGYRGIARTTNSNTWTARIKIDGKAIYLGNYPTKKKAHHAYREASKKIFGMFSPYHD